MDEIQESVKYQKASVDHLQATFEERLDRLEEQLSAYIQNVEDPHEPQSIRRDTQSVKKDFKHAPSSSSLNASIDE